MTIGQPLRTRMPISVTTAAIFAQDEYNHYFREGFQRGYDDGYYGRQKYGRKNDSDGGINDEWLIAGAVVAAIIGYEVLTD